MSFLYAILIGVIFGFSELTIPSSILLVLVLVSFRSLKDIIFKKDFITGVASPYQLYLMHLEKMNVSKSYAALKYYLQSMLFDGLISLTVFGLIRLIV
ncbi:MAG: hypothetical protein M0Q21_06735 [Ignavibacteriaceae bacterium]|nr:hypothetical protein [Ignavibacteriaceae bacterium]